MGFSRPEYWSGEPFSSSGDLPNPGIELRSPALQADSLPAEPQGKPKSIGVGSLSLVHWIFPAQESNRGLLHRRWLLYQLSHEALPTTAFMFKEQDFSNFPVVEILLCLRDPQLIFSYLIICWRLHNITVRSYVFSSLARKLSLILAFQMKMSGKVCCLSHTKADWLYPHPLCCVMK